MERLVNLSAWQDLKKLCKPKATKEAFIAQTLQAANISLNFGMQFVGSGVISSLMTLAKEAGVAKGCHDYFHGGKLNFTEDRATLHTALRAPYDVTKHRVGHLKADEIRNAYEKMVEISNQIRQSKWLGFTGKTIKNIVNIGIGGSDLGPKMAIEALKPYTLKTLNYYFISDADSSSFDDVIEAVNLEETLFIVVSKSFSTRETLLNAQKARELYKQVDQSRLPVEVSRCHFIAVTANSEKAQKFGITTIVSIWNWVGGRFSFCSAVNLILMIAIGEGSFKNMLEGAFDMDEHFIKQPFDSNMPVLLAMLGIYNVNFRHIHNHSILVYNSRLKYLSDYLQQLEMESNGKSLNRWAEKVSYRTCPVIWGGIGNRAQHAYYQLLVQGTQKVSLDFIFDASRNNELVDAYGQNKINILSKGKSTNDWSHIEGKQPVNSITLKDLSPYSLGSLISLYEHKVFIQGWIWQINSFDQFGVESAKKLDSAI